MSGFITIYHTNGEPVDKQLIHSLTQTLKFRGPDQQNVWIDDNIGMGHALFKTTFEAEYENQPATIDNKVWITCSARIDDRENLVNKMGMKHSLDLSSTPDSELILHAYKKWGEECLDHLLGDFAFVIWDKTQQKLFCARDHLGTRQLHYAYINNKIIISNSLNTIRQHPDISKELNDKAIAGFLLTGDYTLIDKTISVYKDISTLAPTHKLTYKNKHIHIKAYWGIPDNLPLLRYKNDNDYIEHFLEIFKESVNDRIRTSKISILMSGGMDSTAIAAIAKNSNSNVKIQAVTSIYETMVNDDEKYYADLVSKHLDIPIHFHLADDYQLFDKGITTTRPLEILTPIQRNDIQRILASYSRAYLTGDAGDCLLEYTPFNSTSKRPVNLFHFILQIYKVTKFFHMLPKGSGIKSVFNPYQKKKEQTYKPNLLVPYPSWLSSEFEQTFNVHHMWQNFQQWTPSSSHRAQMQLTRFNWNSDDVLLNPDFTLSEERDPYRDIRLIKYLFSLPSFPWFYKKYILRNSMSDFLPDEVIKRPKTPLPNVVEKLIQITPTQHLNGWEPHTQLSRYIDLKKLPTVEKTTATPSHRIVNFRPRLLNEWLSQIEML
ncbi:asparagine synthase-related protein [Sulfurovum sp. zt1-1]|uniref:asparagine synthase (glutamine-hydrolyzing) n=1 Tax=Sulfurovum zhangzhouensis TaxID=3019067 RepID=A0ABT7QYG8_9BACT|nr:asparagine synthase-related protein [Sulfurovum zhangzhouensis]MDM5271356.1 asparagine synthase-related protein [Sulfurovum zhangzhouensis]